jgi:fumarate reductase subunit C
VSRLELRLWAVQRVSAVVLALAVLVHLVTIVYAVQGGLSAAEILARTQGQGAWLAFYAVFALAAGVHGAIGLRTIIQEWTAWRGPGLNALALVLAAGLSAAGLTAAWGVFA